MARLSIRDLALLARCVASGPGYPSEDFESYTDGQLVNGLSGGADWAGSWVDRNAPTGIFDQEDFESYTDNADIDGLSGGIAGWSAAWAARDNPYGVKAQEDFESYADNSDLNGQSGGSDWGGAWVDR